MAVFQPARKILLDRHVGRETRRQVENWVSEPVGEGDSAGALSVETSSLYRRNCERKVSEKEEARYSVSE